MPSVLLIVNGGAMAAPMAAIATTIHTRQISKGRRRRSRGPNDVGDRTGAEITKASSTEPLSRAMLIRVAWKVVAAWQYLRRQAIVVRSTKPPSGRARRGGDMPRA